MADRTAAPHRWSAVGSLSPHGFRRVRRRDHRWGPQRPRVCRVPRESRAGGGGPRAPERPRRSGRHGGAVARLSGLERLVRGLADAAADRGRARAETARLRRLHHHAGLLRAVPRWDVAHALGRHDARPGEHRASLGARRRGVGGVRRLLRAGRQAPEGPPVRRAAEHAVGRGASVGEDGRPLPRMDGARHPRAGASVHDERGGLPGRVVRRRAREGRPCDAGDHRRVVRPHDPGLGLRLDAPLDRRGRRALRRVGLGEGRDGRRFSCDRATRPRQPVPRSGRVRR